MNDKIMYLVTAALLIAPVFFPLGSSVMKNNTIVNERDEQSLNITLAAAPFTFTTLTSGKTKIEMKGFNKILTPGLPKLPVKTFLYGLPPGSHIESVSLTSENHIQLKGRHSIANAMPISNGSKIISNRTDPSFHVSGFFPSKPYDYCGMGHIGKYSYAKIRFYPFSLNSHNSSLTLYKNITIKIQYRIEEENCCQSLSLHEKTKQLASSMLENYQTISYLYPTSAHSSNQHFPYVIITTSPLQKSVEFLKNWREITTGESVKIVNTSWIDQEYQGDDQAKKIRLFLKDKYDQWQICYVLIVGSPQYIPMRVCYPNKDDHSDNTQTLTDYYYADLTGEWDSDADGFYGERDEDNPDFFPELYVGRIPVDNPSQVKDICQKIINFEQNDQPWKKKALLLGAILYFAGENHEDIDKTDGATLMETLKEEILIPNDYTVTTMYEKEGRNPSVYNCDYPLTRENVKQFWSDGYGFVDWNAHGSSQASERKYWNYDDGDNIPENSELSHPNFITSDDVFHLNNDKPSIVFSCSCKNACPDKRDNLGVSLLNQGGVAFVGATSTTWSSVGWKGKQDGGIQTINCDFIARLFNRGDSCGESLYNTLFEYITHYDFEKWGWKIYQNMYGYSLYGDPALSLETFTTFSPPNIPETPQGAFEGNVSAEIFFTTSTEDSDGQKVYYKWSWGDGDESEWMGPYPSGDSIQASHSWDEPGVYEIKVKASDTIGSESNWSEHFFIDIVAPNVQIEEIKGGIGRIKVVVHNSGGVTATDIVWSIAINKTFSSSITEGVIQTLKPQESTVIKSDFVFGFGKASATVGLNNQEQVKTLQILLMGPFLFAL